MEIDNSRISEDLRKVTYSDTYNNPLQNKLIKLIEKALVRQKFYQRFLDLYYRVDQGEAVNTAVLEAFGLKVELKKGSLENIPKRGPVIVVGNHPFGIVDGIVVASMIKSVRPDLKVMAHQGVSDIPLFSKYFLPINFSGTEDAKKINKKTIHDFKSHVSNGGVGVIFPAGAVSTKRPIWKKNTDPPWFPSAAKWARDFNAQVVPVFIDGHCGPLFQLVSQFSMTLRLASLLYENTRLIDSEIGMRVGEPIDVRALSCKMEPVEMTEYFRKETYGLAGLDERGRCLKTSVIANA